VLAAWWSAQVPMEDQQLPFAWLAIYRVKVPVHVSQRKWDRFLVNK
jgi:hypothetical protein